MSSTDDACEVGATTAPAGVVRFAVANNGSQVTEFYVLAADGVQVLGEVENVGPGLTRDLVVQLAPGSYTLACKPGMTGDGIRSEFTVTGSAADAAETGAGADAIAAATAAYVAFVQEQTEELVEETEKFVDAYKAGDDQLARSLYAPTRMYWERIEPVAESFGDLDARTDAREADLEPGQQWTGWHRIEKDLWPPAAADYTPLTSAERAKVADQLLTDVKSLHERSETLQFTAAQIGNGAKELMDEVATGKITGEEDIWSHTDLWDFQANLDGAKVMYTNLRPVVEQRDSELAATLDSQFAKVQAELDKYRDGEGFVLYDQLTPQQVKQIAAAVDALGEPLSKLTSTVLL